MPRKTKSSAIVPAGNRAIVERIPKADIQAMVARLVHERVDAIIAERDAGQGVPEFLPKGVSVEIRADMEVFERRKWSLYFDKFGCKACHRKTVVHGDNGYCIRCRSLIYQRLRALKEEFNRTNPEAEIAIQIDRLTRPFRTARALFEEGDDDLGKSGGL